MHKEWVQSSIITFSCFKGGLIIPEQKLPSFTRSQVRSSTQLPFNTIFILLRNSRPIIYLYRPQKHDFALQLPITSVSSSLARQTLKASFDRTAERPGKRDRIAKHANFKNIEATEVSASCRQKEKRTAAIWTVQGKVRPLMQKSGRIRKRGEKLY